MLESKMHQSSLFVTLTYDQEHLPEGATLVPRHLVLYLKRLRKAVEPLKFRYYAAGEYGDQTWRPHYHVLIFGLPSLPAVARTWTLGHVHIGTVTKQSVSYVAKYQLKNMRNSTDPRLMGRYPEFARMSRRPGIGGDAVEEIANVLTTESGCDHLVDSGDVPLCIRVAGNHLPLDRYLRRKIRESVGWDGKCPEDILKYLALQEYLKDDDAGRKQKRLYAKNKAQWIESFNRGKGERSL